MAESAYQVVIGERTLHVRVRHASEGTFARVDDGPEIAVRLEQVRGAQHLLELGMRRLDVMAARSGGRVDVALGGFDFEAEVEDAVRARLAQMTAARGGTHARRELRAPMPGLVVKVLVSVGDHVEPGQPLVVLQAMKMENELSVPRGGVVKQVDAQAGQTVESGSLLLVVE